MSSSDSTLRESDAALVREALQDSRALAAIIERYEAPLSRYVRRLGCAPEDAADVLQEIFLKAYVNLRSYDERLAFSSWLYRIAHNEAVSFFRRENVRPQAVATEEELEQFDTIVDEMDTAEQLHKKHTAESIRRALTHVEESYREVLVLRYFEDKQYDEIADILKMPIGTVGTYVTRGKAQLKKFLEVTHTEL